MQTEEATSTSDVSGKHSHPDSSILPTEVVSIGDDDSRIQCDLEATARMGAARQNLVSPT